MEDDLISTAVEARAMANSVNEKNGIKPALSMISQACKLGESEALIWFVLPLADIAELVRRGFSVKESRDANGKRISIVQW